MPNHWAAPRVAGPASLRARFFTAGHQARAHRTRLLCARGVARGEKAAAPSPPSSRTGASGARALLSGFSRCRVEPSLACRANHGSITPALHFWHETSRIANAPHHHALATGTTAPIGPRGLGGDRVRQVPRPCSSRREHACRTEAWLCRFGNIAGRDRLDAGCRRRCHGSRPTPHQPTPPHAAPRSSFASRHARTGMPCATVSRHTAHGPPRRSSATRHFRSAGRCASPGGAVLGRPATRRTERLARGPVAARHREWDGP